MASSHDSTDSWDGIPEHWGRGHYRDVPISKWIKLCRDRQVRDLRRSIEDPTFPFELDQEKADKAVWFFNCLRHFQSPFNGKQFILADWQEWDIIRPLFGWVKRSDGLRRFKEANVFIPKKMGKSPLAAGIAAYMFIADNEYGGEVACGATKEDQAKIVWNYARKMMDLSPELKDEYKTFKRALASEVLGSRFFYIGQDSKGSDGLNLNGGIIDEYHAHKTSEIKDIIRQAMASRLQPLCVTITTLGYGEKTPCDDEFEISKSILEGRVVDETYFAFLSTVDDPEKWDQEEEWYKANPNLGISVSIERFREDIETAKKNPRKLAEFKCKRLNIKQSKFGSWIPVEILKRGNKPIDWSRFKGQRCFGGGDLGISGDLSAAAFVFQGEGKGTLDGQGKLILPEIFVKMMYWVPEENLEEKYRNDGVPYPQWVAQGKMIATPGPTRRSDLILRDIKEQIIENYDLDQFAADQNNAHDLMTGLADAGVREVVKNSQGFAGMNFPCTCFETAVLSNRINYDDDPLIEWMLGNVAILRNAKDEIMLAKHHSRGRIDGLVALCMALGRLAIAPEPTNFVYNFRGIYSG